MNSARRETAVPAHRPLGSSASNQILRQWWSIITVLLGAAIFAEAIFAGALLSGIGWARPAHAISAMALIAATLVAGVASSVTLRRISQGTRLAVTLLGLAAVVLIQTAIGRFSAHGANLLWLHVPLGVALVGFAALAAAGARRLGAS